jgi:valyl-tRNA synthetase
MKVLIVLLFIVLYTQANQLPNAKNGKTLYLDGKCHRCHKSNSSSFDDKKHKVKNLKNLDTWVGSCATHFKVFWFPEEEKDVAKYLNELHYKF